jgi:hypothetical protein
MSVVAAAAGVLLVAGAPLALAQTADYTGTEDTDTGVLSGVTTRTPVTSSTTVSNARTSPTTLPFTGGEVILIAAAGAAAVAAGAGMIASGRRRAPTAN